MVGCGEGPQGLQQVTLHIVAMTAGGEGEKEDLLDQIAPVLAT